MFKKVKVCYDGDIRLWRFKKEKAIEDSRYDDLLQFVCTAFKFSSRLSFSLQYIDDEDDKLTIFANSDLDDAVETATFAKRKYLRIFVTKNEPEENSQQILKATDIRGEEKRELMIDFFQDADIELLLPDLIQNIVAEIKFQDYNQHENEIQSILQKVLKLKKFESIKTHKLYPTIIEMVPRFAKQIESNINILLNFNEDVIAAWIPHLISLVLPSLKTNQVADNMSVIPDKNRSDNDLNNLFPIWCAFMNYQSAIAKGGNRGAINYDNLPTHAARCAGCYVYPIRGACYNCSICLNVSLCSRCEASHDISHPLLKFTLPLNETKPPLGGLCQTLLSYGNSPNQWFGHHWRNRNKRNKQQNNDLRVCRNFRKGGGGGGGPKKMAEFVSDVTLPDRSCYPLDTVLKKTWRMRNTGNFEWGTAVELVFFKGNEVLTLLKRYPVVNARPGQIVDVSAVVRTPQTNGRYCAYYRLRSAGIYFGPRVWVDIFAGSAKSERKAKGKGKRKMGRNGNDGKNAQGQLGSAQRGFRYNQKGNANGNGNRNGNRNANRKGNANLNVVEYSMLEEIADVVVHEIGNEQVGQNSGFPCVCGVPMFCTTPLIAYNHNGCVACDACQKSCAPNERIYHCPKGRQSEAHPRGCVLCTECMKLQKIMAASQQSQKHNNVTVQIGPAAAVLPLTVQQANLPAMLPEQMPVLIHQAPFMYPDPLVQNGGLVDATVQSLFGCQYTQNFRQ